MNEYKFENLKVGLCESFIYQVTNEKLELFKQLTGDINPLHNNREFAVLHGQKDRVVYGMITASLISTLGGVYLPGKYCLIQEVNTKFYRPVFVGDILNVSGIVDELNDTVKQCVIKVSITNQDNIKVLKGKLVVGFTE